MTKCFSQDMLTFYDECMLFAVVEIHPEIVLYSLKWPGTAVIIILV